MGSIVFIITYFLLIELLDLTLRDATRSRRLTKLPVIAAFNGTSNLKFRGFLKACNRLAAAYSCRQLNNYLQKRRPHCYQFTQYGSKRRQKFPIQIFC